MSDARSEPAGLTTASSATPAPQSRDRSSRAGRAFGRPGAFAVAATGAGVVVGIAAVLVAIDRPSLPSGLLAPLVALGLLMLGLLVRNVAPGLAYAALVLASLTASGVPITLARETDPGSVGIGQWLVAAVRAVGPAIFTVSIAAVYATRPERRLTGAVTTVTKVMLAWFVAACLLVVILIVTGNGGVNEELTWIDVATLPTALFVDLVLLLVAFGALGDIRAATLRADARAAVSTLGADGPGTVLDRMTAVLRELLPGIDPGEAAVAAERTRLASDIHAAVLPALRRAIAEAEAGGPPELLATRLRTVDAELERLMADRWPVVLETFGLIPALEEVAERIEAETDMAVTLAVDRDEGRPPAHVERAGWRIAQLALDNAIRHAVATTVSVAVWSTPDRLEVTIRDDGRGFDVALGGDPGRGVRDIVRRAEAVGGAASIESPAEVGTTVRFAWPAATGEAASQRG